MRVHVANSCYMGTRDLSDTYVCPRVLVNGHAYVHTLEMGGI